jgi:hypothetical protein
MGDKCNEEIQKWGRFQVVQNRKQADLILLLSAREYVLPQLEMEKGFVR